MKRIALCLVLIVLCGCVVSGCNRTPGVMPPVEVCFSPHGGCTEAVVHEIDNAQSSILVQAYSFTATPIAKALVEAQQRGVHVEVILDKSQKTEEYSEADFLLHAGIPVAIDAKHAIAHNKVMIIDGRVVITGSFNFTKQAEEHNAENLLIIKGKADLYAAYESNFQAHAAHSVPYKGLAEANAATTPQTTPGSIPAPPKAANSTPAASPATATTPSASQPQNDPIVHITKSGKKYHREGCRYLSKSDIPVKLSEAKARGFGPCSACRPPE